MFNPVEFAKHKPVTTALVVGGVVVGALLWNSAQQPAQGNSDGFFLQGPSDAQVSASSNLAIANAQIASQNSNNQLQAQEALTIAGIQRDVSLASLTVDDNKDARANSTAITLASLQTQLGIRQADDNLSAAQSANKAATSQKNNSNTAGIIGAVGSVVSVIGGLFGL